MISIDRFWTARGHIREGINWIERGLRASPSLPLAKALRLAAGLLHHAEVTAKAAIDRLQESLTIARQLNDVISPGQCSGYFGGCQLAFGDFEKAKAYYAESLELYRTGGDPQYIGLSLASAGRLYIDYGLFRKRNL